MYVGVIPNRQSPPAILLRESYRENGKTKNRTLANLSSWPAEKIEQLRAVLRGDRLLPVAQAIEIIRALPHGHVLAALGTARRIDIESLWPRRAPQRQRDLAQALINAGVLDPAPTSPPHGFSIRLPLKCILHRNQKPAWTAGRNFAHPACTNYRAADVGRDRS